MQSRPKRKVMLSAIICAALAPTIASAASYRMVIQIHPDVGGKCIDVPYSQFVIGMRLQLWDCNNSPAQIFSYDETSQQLMIGSLCMESWGRGDPQDAVGLGACNGSANQHWRMVANGDYYQIIGINNRCLELRYGLKTNGAALDVMDCDAGRPQRLWSLVEAPSAPMEIAGNWCSKEGPNSSELRTSIEQEALELKFHNEHGQISRGHFIGASEIVAVDWGQLHAQVSAGGNRINWSNGSVWEHKPNCSP